MIVERARENSWLVEDIFSRETAQQTLDLLEPQGVNDSHIQNLVDIGIALTQERSISRKLENKYNWDTLISKDGSRCSLVVPNLVEHGQLFSWLLIAPEGSEYCLKVLRPGDNAEIANHSQIPRDDSSSFESSSRQRMVLQYEFPFVSHDFLRAMGDKKMAEWGVHVYFPDGNWLGADFNVIADQDLENREAVYDYWSFKGMSQRGVLDRYAFSRLHLDQLAFVVEWRGRIIDHIADMESVTGHARYKRAGVELLSRMVSAFTQEDWDEVDRLEEYGEYLLSLNSDGGGESSPLSRYQDFAKESLS